MINLHSATEINSIVELISSNFIDSENSNTKINKELLFVFFNILGKDQIQNLNQDFDNIYDNRLLPSLFITENINAAIADQDFNNFLINVVLSLNNKEWKDLHPIYLNTVISGFLKSENKEINKKIILEIFNNYKIL